MNEPDLFILADQTLNEKVIQKIKDDQWEMELPEDFPTMDESKTYTLREMIDYHAYDEAWVPAMLAGRTMEDVGKNAFGKPSGSDLLGDTPKENYGQLSAKAVAAAREFPGDELDSRTVHFSYGDYPAREAFWHITSFRGMRVYDLSRALGLDTEMPEPLVEGLWKMTKPHAEEWRAMGVFGPKIDVPEDASLQNRLLALTGRAPQ